MKRLILFGLIIGSLAGKTHAAPPYSDRFVFVFGWNLDLDQSVPEISKVLETAAKHGLNGALMSGFDSLSMQSPEHIRRLEQVSKACEQNHLELIPGLFTIGYGGSMLGHNPNLAEGLPVTNAPFLVHAGEARLGAAPVRMANGGFEDFSGNKAAGFNFTDDPGQVSFIDTNVMHGGKASLRMEHFTANPYGHGRVMQEIHVRPHRCYRLTAWVKTEGLQPKGIFRLLLLAKEQELAPREFNLPPTSDWRKLSMLFNSLDYDTLNFYAGVWGGKEGKFWLDDFSIEEVGPVNVLRRPGTPVSVQNREGTTSFTEGADYTLIPDPHFSPWHDDGPAATLKILPNSRIHEGDALRVSWYHSMLINDSQVVICMAEPEVYDIMDREAKLLAEKFHPHKVLLNMDEVRMGGTCRACAGRNMGELLGECITRQAQIVHRYLPDAKIYVWSDMLDPTHNAHANYYLVKGDFAGSWNHVPKDLVMAVWGGEPRPESLRFFSGLGFETMGACYYDADDLNDVKRWLELGRQTPKIRGFMYTPWLQKYSLLPEFGDLLLR